MGSALPPEIAAAFATQAGFCRFSGSPLTALLCEALADVLDQTSMTGRAVMAWPGQPFADALMMRLTGGCNALVRAGAAPMLAPLYPPAPLPSLGALVAGVAASLADADFDTALHGWLAGPPQTNEVARAGALMPGLMAIAALTRLPLRLFELGASAGLNLNLDRFGYRLGGVSAGDPASPLQLEPAWDGPPPPAVAIKVQSRVGVDIQPLDVSDAAVRARLMAFVWPDQRERVARAEAGIALALAHPPSLVAGDAADFIEASVGIAPDSVAVVFHSIAYQYFPPETKARIVAHLGSVGASASATAALAWLRFEMDDPAKAELPTLRLTLWQGVQPLEQFLARVHPHGSTVQWQ